MTARPGGYADISAMPEDERIAFIAHLVCAHGLTAAVCVDDDPGKPERYAAKMETLGCRVLEQAKGPITGVVTLKVGPINVN